MPFVVIARGRREVKSIGASYPSQRTLEKALSAIYRQVAQVRFDRGFHSPELSPELSSSRADRRSRLSRSDVPLDIFSLEEQR
jgi:hypothetical protein